MHPERSTNDGDLDSLLLDHAAGIAQVKELVKDVLEPHYDDVWLLRFLISNGTPSACEEPIRFTIKWRAERKEILAKVRDGHRAPFHEEVTKYQVVGDHNYTALGEPLFIARVGLCNAVSLMDNVAYNDILEYMLISREKMVAYLETKSREQRQLIKGITVLDFAGYSFRWGSEPRFSKLLGECSVLMEKMYPQLIGRSIIVNTPSYFSWLFRFIKPLLSEETLAKVVLCPGGSSVADCPYLSKYLVLSDLPSFLGGDCTCDGKGCIGDIPNTQTVSFNDNGLTSLTIGIRSTQTIDIPVKSGKRLLYTLKAPGKSLNVSIVFRPFNHLILPKQTLALANGIVDGTWLAPKEGIASLIFENSARFGSRTVLYKTEVIDE